MELTALKDAVHAAGLSDAFNTTVSHDASVSSQLPGCGVMCETCFGCTTVCQLCVGCVAGAIL